MIFGELACSHTTRSALTARIWSLPYIWLQSYVLSTLWAHSDLLFQHPWLHKNNWFFKHTTSFSSAHGTELGRAEQGSRIWDGRERTATQPVCRHRSCPSWACPAEPLCLLVSFSFSNSVGLGGNSCFGSLGDRGGHTSLHHSRWAQRRVPLLGWASRLPLSHFLTTPTLQGFRIETWKT